MSLFYNDIAILQPPFFYFCQSLNHAKITTIQPMTNPSSPQSPIARVQFLGSPTAGLFAREVAESFQGVLARNMITDPQDPNAGFTAASIDGRPWFDTMWTRDAGVFLRELAQWGCLDQAVLLAESLMSLVRPNREGCCTFPEYFKLGQPGSGSELDGTGAIVIGLVLLWQRLPPGQTTRQRIQAFLAGAQSPLNYIRRQLEKGPLVAGSGEFGGGCGIPGEFYNPVQNNLVHLALRMAARMFLTLAEPHRAAQCEQSASLILENMLRCLRAANGAWMWAIDPHTFQPDPAIVNHPINRGFGGINGILAMTGDVNGFTPAGFDQALVEASRKTFEQLLAFPKRQAAFDQHSIWTQFDSYCHGYLSGSSYGQGYAAQAMLLLDRLEMAGKAIDGLAEVTYRPFPGNAVDRDSDFFFYERFYLPELLENPDAINEGGNTFYDGARFDQGCGALNLVCVAEPLKIARLVVGLDDHDPQHPQIIPRLPPAWSGYEAENWPALTAAGLARVNLHCERYPAGLRLEVSQVEGPHLPEIEARLPAGEGWVWQTRPGPSSLRVLALYGIRYEYYAVIKRSNVYRMNSSVSCRSSMPSPSCQTRALSINPAQRLPRVCCAQRAATGLETMAPSSSV